MWLTSFFTAPSGFGSALATTSVGLIFNAMPSIWLLLLGFAGGLVGLGVLFRLLTK